MRKITFLIFICFIFTSCQSTIFRPEKGIIYNPMYVKRQVEDFAVITEDNTTLHAWRVQSKSEKKSGVILFFHGNGGNIGTELFQVAWLLDYGYDIFLADYRGYGFSHGKPSIELFLSDSLDIMDSFMELYNGNRNIIVLGQSLGGQAATNVATNSKYGDKINLLILDSTFTSWRSIAKELSASIFITWPFQSLIALNFPDNKSAINFIPLTKAKNILILHSKDDKLINYKNSEQLYNEALKNTAVEHIKYETFDNLPHAAILHDIKSRKRLLDSINSFIR